MNAIGGNSCLKEIPKCESCSIFSLAFIQSGFGQCFQWQLRSPAAMEFVSAYGAHCLSGWLSCIQVHFPHRMAAFATREFPTGKGVIFRRNALQMTYNIK